MWESEAVSHQKWLTTAMSQMKHLGSLAALVLGLYFVCHLLIQVSDGKMWE